MKHAIIITLFVMTFGLMTTAAWAFDGRSTYESGDGHWIYFGPAQTGDWTAERQMPLKRTLEGSIRGDALRHYEMPRHVLPESGTEITFYDGSKTLATKKGETVESVYLERPEPIESPWKIYELPESGHTIVFCETNDPAGCG